MNVPVDKNSTLLPLGAQYPEAWRALTFYTSYRILIAILFVALVWLAELPEPLGDLDQRMFEIIAHLYLLFAVLAFVPLQMQIPRFPYQVAGQVIVDILLLSLALYASGGVASGFGMLIAIAVASGSLLKPGRVAYFFAAIAAIAVLGTEVYSQLTRIYPTPNYTHAATLGITFFITAFICHALALRLRESEALAARRAVDIENLARLNEYIVQHMQSGIIVLGPEARIRMVNAAARRLLNWDSDVLGQPLQSTSPRLATALREWLGSTGDTVEVLRCENAEADVQVSFRELSPRTTAGTLIFLEDAAALQQRAQQMKLASLGRLAGSIAHEVRNPLGAISHAGQLLSESGELSEADQRLTQIINSHSRRVNAIIENVMRISRRERSTPQQLLLDDWLNSFVTEFQQQKALTKNDIQVDINPAGLTVTVDPSQLQQVLWNLCENAIRYSRRMPLLLIRAGIRHESGRAYLDVIDTGPGIIDDIARHIFEPFMTSEQHGTGLGLYIARELCEANLASLSLVENSDDGCHFRISFPVQDRSSQDHQNQRPNQSGTIAAE